jgi:hypothetical protein
MAVTAKWQPGGHYGYQLLIIGLQYLESIGGVNKEDLDDAISLAGAQPEFLS